MTKGECSQTGSALPGSPETRLKDLLLRNYRRDSFPRRSQSERPVVLKMGLAIISLPEMNQISGSFTLNVWLRHKWRDDFLRWDCNDNLLDKDTWAFDTNISSEERARELERFADVPMISFETEPEYDGAIWVPDMLLHNTAEMPMQALARPQANVYRDGTVIWSRPGLMSATCKFGMDTFPYDEQRCELKVGSWAYASDVLKVELAPDGFEPPLDMSQYINKLESPEWKLRANDAPFVERQLYACCPSPYETVHFPMVATRKSTFYTQTFLCPALAILASLLLSCFIPSFSGERIAFATTMTLALSVFLLMLSEYVPKTDEIPTFTKLFMGMLYGSLAFLLVIIGRTRLEEKWRAHRDKQERNEKHEDHMERITSFMSHHSRSSERVESHGGRSSAHSQSSEGVVVGGAFAGNASVHGDDPVTSV